MRTLTGYGIGVVIVLAVLNGIAWKIGMLRLHSLNVFSVGFVLACSECILPLGFMGTGSPYLRSAKCTIRNRRGTASSRLARL